MKNLLLINRKIGKKHKDLYVLDNSNPIVKEMYTCLVFDKSATYSLVYSEENDWANNSCEISPVHSDLALEIASSSTSDAEYLAKSDFSNLRYLASDNFTYDFNPGTLAFGFVCNDVNPPDELGVITWGINTGTTGLYVYIKNGNLNVACGVWNSHVATFAITNGERYYCTYKADRSGTGGFLFVNGVKVAENATNNVPGNTEARCEIGRIFEGLYGNSLNGFITHVFFFNSAFEDVQCELLSKDPFYIFDGVIPGLGYVGDIVDAGGEPTTVNDSYSVTSGEQKVVSAPGILDNDTYDCT